MKLSQTLPARLRASAIHFGLSLVVFLILLGVIVCIWYPGALFWIDGGMTGVQILIAVDLVLGPLLTLIIYNPTKTRRHIMIDFMFIAAIQISALVWGVNTIYEQKPQAIVFDGAAFQIMDNDYLQRQESDVVSLNESGATLPLVLYSRKPETADEVADVMLHLFNNSIPEWAVVALLEPVDRHLPALKIESAKVKRQYQKNTSVMARYQKIVTENGAADHELLLLSLSGRFGEALVVLDQNGSLVGSFTLD